MAKEKTKLPGFAVVGRMEVSRNLDSCNEGALWVTTWSRHSHNGLGSYTQIYTCFQCYVQRRHLGVLFLFFIAWH